MANGHEPIADDELLYRRVPVTWYDSATGLPLDNAFAPRKESDTTGLSLSRAKYKTVEQAAISHQAGKSYYVAELRALDLRQAGIALAPKPTDDDPGHCELPDLRADNRKESVTLEKQAILVALTLRVHGPFTTPNATAAG